MIWSKMLSRTILIYIRKFPLTVEFFFKKIREKCLMLFISPFSFFLCITLFPFQLKYSHFPTPTSKHPCSAFPLYRVHCSPCGLLHLSWLLHLLQFIHSKDSEIQKQKLRFKSICHSGYGLFSIYNIQYI